jgi:hypothetical protein
MIGSWKGIYRFDNENIQKIRGYDETEFEIIIEKFDGKSFTGKVFDDEKTGGMKGTGEIVGNVENNQIYFEKAMPLNCQINSKGLEYSEKRHPTIYYYGKLSDNGEKFEGIWKFKKKLGFLFYIIPIIYRPGKGTWKMEQKKNSL